MTRHSGTSIVLGEVFGERLRQDAKWGEQNHGLADWTDILGEEFGEVCKASVERRAAVECGNTEEANHQLQNLRIELVQLAAVAVSIVECIDRSTPWITEQARARQETGGH